MKIFFGVSSYCFPGNGANFLVEQLRFSGLERVLSTSALFDLRYLVVRKAKFVAACGYILIACLVDGDLEGRST
jgi:hypothetical protein